MGETGTILLVNSLFVSFFHCSAPSTRKASGRGEWISCWKRSVRTV